MGMEAARDTITPRSGTRPSSTVVKPLSTPISRSTFCAVSLSVSNGLPTRGTMTSRASRATRRGSRHERRSRNVSEPTTRKSVRPGRASAASVSTVNEGPGRASSMSETSKPR